MSEPLQQTPPAPAAAPKSGVDEAAKLVNALVARIYDTQKKLGIWGEALGGADANEDLAQFFAEMHHKVSVAYKGWAHEGQFQNVDGEDFILDAVTMPTVLMEICMQCLGLCKRRGYDVGRMFLEAVVQEARIAAAVAKAKAEGTDVGEAMRGIFGDVPGQSVNEDDLDDADEPEQEP